MRCIALLLVVFLCTNALGQTIKTNILTPVAVYSEFKIKPKQTFQIGISYVPYYLNLGKTNDASIIVEYRKYKPKIGAGMTKLWENNFPRGPFSAPYIKISNISKSGINTNAIYAGFALGYKQIRLIGEPKKSIEFFVGFGVGSPLLFGSPNELNGTKIDIRCGIALGLHYKNKENKPQKRKNKE